MNKILSVLKYKKAENPPPIWLMRQAGRYLPEYRKIREKFPHFMDFCLTPEAIETVTLQPITRFDFDAAIIFCDILILPHLLGQKVEFIAGKGPVLEAVNWETFLEKGEKKNLLGAFSPILQSIKTIRQALCKEKSLIGFIGSPWTIATYMVNQKKYTEEVFKFYEENKTLFKRLLTLLTDQGSAFLIEQVKAGCDTVQIFDSWAGLVPLDKREEFLWGPLEKIYNKLQKTFPKNCPPIIYYGRGVYDHYEELEKRFPNLCFGVDETVDIQDITLTQPFQGNLDPEKLLSQEFIKDTLFIKEKIKGKPFIFNLGHGIKPNTPLDHVYQLVEIIRK